MSESRIIVAGIGPGSVEDITPAVMEALRTADAVVGYKYYFQFIEAYVREGCACIDTGMMKERERAEQAFLLAKEGKNVVVVSSGDAGLYGMHGQALPFGIPDTEFALLNGREKMITKMPIRLLTLQALELSRRQVFWDIGFCTGSVSIEAKQLFPHLQIEAFEIRPECAFIDSIRKCMPVAKASSTDRVVINSRRPRHPQRHPRRHAGQSREARTRTPRHA